MKAYILAVLLTTPAFAADQVNLEPFESITVMCNAFENPECPTPEVDNYANHGGTHAEAVNMGLDCTRCHGNELKGTVQTITDRVRNCAAPDGFVPPIGMAEQVVQMQPYGIPIVTTMTKIGTFPEGAKVGCYSCHDEVEVYVDGREREFDFEDLREDILDNLGFDEEGSNPPPVELPVYQCAEVHNSNTDCTGSGCHMDGRSCE